MFILGSLFWFLVQIPLSYLLFFAKLLAVNEQQMVMRIALIDGPLRGIQLLGFAALIIAGVSQRFVPQVWLISWLALANSSSAMLRNPRR